MKKQIPVRLIAQRKALGLNLTELSELPVIKQDFRAISHYELGNRKPPQSYIDSMNAITTQYKILAGLIERDLSNIKSDMSAARLQDAELCSQKLALPLFASFDDFVAYRGDSRPSDLTYWRIWQSAIAHLSLTDHSIIIEDNSPIADCFTSTRLWFFYSNDLANIG